MRRLDQLEFRCDRAFGARVSIRVVFEGWPPILAEDKEVGKLGMYTKLLKLLFDFCDISSWADFEITIVISTVVSLDHGVAFNG